MFRICIYNICIVFVTLISCKKTINDDPSITYFETDSNVSFKSRVWKKISNTSQNINCLASYNGILYYSVLTYDPYYGYSSSLYKYIDEDEYSYSFRNATGIYYRMTVVDNILWFLGDFQEWKDYSKNFYDISYYENDTYEGKIIEGNDIIIFDIEKYNGKYVIAGSFYDNEPMKSSNIDVFSKGTMLGFKSGLNDVIYDLQEYKGKLYACGDNNITDNAVAVTAWNNNNWESNNLTNSGYKFGYSMSVFNDTLYLTGCLLGSTFSLYKLSSIENNEWQEIPEISTKKYTDIIHVKSDGEFLIVYGDNLYLNGKNTSNIIVYDGAKWFPVGRLTNKIFDISVYKGKMYAGTESGLYKFDIQ